MTLKNFKDINFNNEDTLSMKIFEKPNYQGREEEIKNSILESDDSDMKIFIMK